MQYPNCMTAVFIIDTGEAVCEKRLAYKQMLQNFTDAIISVHYSTV